MSFNVYSFLRKLLPHFLRKEKTLALLKALAKPLQDINGYFTDFSYSIKFKLAFNAQIIYLEQYLNETYPNPYVYPSNIHILDTANVIFTYIYNLAEARPAIYFFNVSESGAATYLSNQSELISGADYIIKIPLSVTTGQDVNGVDYNENIFRKRVNFYNLAGNSYELQTF